MYSKSLKKQVEIFYKTNNTNIANTAKRFNIPYTTIKTWVDNEGWQSGEAIKDIETTAKEVVTNNFNIVTKHAKEDIKKEIENNLGALSYDIDKIVLDSLINESSEAILIQAMSLNHINKSLALNASIAKNALLNLNATNDGSIQHNAAIVACSEKVSKIFLDLKESLYGKDIKMANTQTIEYDEMSEAELRELLKQSEDNKTQNNH